MSLKAKFLSLLLGLSLGLAAPSIAAQGQLEERSISAQEYRQGIRYVYQEMLARSPDPYQVFSEEEIRAEVDRLLAKKGPVSEGEMFIDLSRLIGLMRDGHSWVFLDDRDTALFSRSVPLRFRTFSDGLFVRAAAPAYSELVGAKVTAINGVGIDEAWPKILDAVGGGGQIARGRAHVYVQMPDFLRATGLAGRKNAIQYGFRLADGRSVTRTLPAEKHETYGVLWEASQGLATPKEWVEPEQADKASWYRNHDRAFWYEYQPQSRTVYAQFNMATTDPDDPWNPSEDKFRPMLDEIFKRVSQPDADRLVIDVRNNHGGNSALWQPLVHGIIRTEKLSEPGRLFVIIGPQTESAAVAWAAQIEGNARAVFVGEHTASPPNFFNDPAGPRRARFDVPGTPINFFIANREEQWSSSDDYRRAIYPDIPTPLSSSDFATGRDPAMNAVLEVSPERAESFFVDSDGDPIRATALWANYRRQSQKDALPTEQ